MRIKKRAKTDDEIKILIVDDDENICKILTLIFGKMGYEAESVGTGKAALEKVQETFYNVILLDIKLPDIEGIELIALLRKTRPITLIMMVTAFASQETAIEALNRGASAYITKPFNMEKIFLKVKDAVEKQQLAIERDRLYQQLQDELKERKKIEKALRLNEEKLRKITKTSPDYIMMLDSECKIQFVNRTEQGVTLEDLIDSPLYNLVEEKERPRIKKVLEDVIDHERSVYYETTYKRPDGTIIHYESHAAPMESDKTVVGIIVNSRDVTERKKVEEALRKSEERLRRFMDSATDSIFLLDTELNIIDINRQGLKEMGQSEQEIIGKNIVDFVPDVKESGRYDEYMGVIRTGKPLILENVVSHPKYGEKHYSVKAFKVGDGLGTMSTDITEGKQAEEKLRASEASLAKAQQIAHLGSWEWNIETNDLSWSDEVFHIFGLVPDEFDATYEAFISSVHPNDREFVNKSVNDAVHKNQPYNIEHRVVRPNKEERVVYERAEILYDESGKPIRMFGTVHDITDRKKAETALRESEERYALAQKAGNLGTWDWNILTGTLEWSEIVAPMFGYMKGEFVETYEGFLESVHPEDRQFVIDSVNSSVDEGEEYNIEHRIVLSDGSIRWVSEKGDVLRNESGEAFRMVGVVQDITERKNAEIALMESERKFKHLAEKSPNMIFINKRGRVVYANEKCEETMGYSRDEFYDSNFDFLVLIAPEYRELIIDSFQRHLQDKESGPIEYTLIAKDGTRIPAIFSSKLIDYEGDKAILGIITDITERKRAEIALAQVRDTLVQKVEVATRDLREEKQRLETVVETIPDGIAVIDREGNIYIVNKVFKDYYQRIYNTDFPISLKLLSLLKNPFGDTVSKLFYSKTPESFTIEPIKGLYLQLASSRLILTPDTHLGVVISVHDVTPFVELDNTRKQFVSVVSHELRTPITAINLSLRNLQKFRKKISEEQLDEIINMTNDSAQVLTQMIEDLLVASRVEAGKIKLDWEPYQLSNIIQGVLNVLEPRRVSKSIALKIDINTEISLYGDEKRISQIFRILVDNAIKYSTRNSNVIIKAINNYHGKYNPTAQEGILLQVIDSGRGIPKEDLPYIFDRFFRSKDVSDKRGSGLGLSIAQELISFHHGEIYVDSKHGKGSTFSVFLPRIEKHFEKLQRNNEKQLEIGGYL